VFEDRDWPAGTMTGAAVRPTDVPYRTESERYFGIYLNRRRLPFEYERQVGEKFPDFFVEHPSAGSVVVEVHEFAHTSPPNIGAVDPYGPIRTTINEKRAQGKGTKGKWPYVLVLYTFGWPMLDVNAVTGAMFGNIAVQMRINTASGAEERDQSRVFGHDGKMIRSRPEAEPRVQNTTFSAVVILRMFNPTQVRLNRAAQAIPQGVQPAEFLTRHTEIVAQVTQDGLYRPDLHIPRLIVCHNPNARVPLPLDAFGGPHDEQWTIAADDGALHLAATGLGFHEVPNSHETRLW
jgi:hypothetical protein